MKFSLNRTFTVYLSLLFVAGLALSEEEQGSWEFSGFIGLETRVFPENAAFSQQLADFQASLSIEPELTWENEEGSRQIGLVLFGRLDSEDGERSHFDIREAYWRGVSDQWEVTMGLTRVFWGVTESRHLVNIINQIDQVEALDEEDFLGQPMLQISRQTSFGLFSSFVLPRFRERTFPGRSGRLRGPLSVDRDSALYESGAGKWHVDYALRYSHYIGDWDLGLSYFYGTSREPRFHLSIDGKQLIPVYDLIHQIGFDLQYTRDAWLWKFEGIVREGQGDTFGSIVGGLEYTFYQTFGGNMDIGLLAEYLYDGQDQGFAPPTIFDNDLFTGARFAFNDVSDTAILAGTVVDLDDGTASIRVEAERRLGDSYKIEVVAQAFSSVAPRNTAFAFRNDSYLQVSLSRFF